ncbi:putative serine protease K12H4.7 [Pectinophora gossypiella]|uniref:putative serine protease K12H4.7 n=1 Tax=Pectinophora gossypiella TaxID=13191 RepID=UPI00214F12DD|nr:putative serine protease K12H4.7 [Pectinophora gossypiella]
MFQLLLLCLACAALSWAELTPTTRIVEPPLRVDLQPPEEYQNLPTRNVNTLWITMPTDHFDPQNPDTFKMRFMINEQFFGGDGSPIFIMVGGEWTIATGWLLTGNMFEMARENNGYLVYTEHRYYGQTLPYEEFTAETLRFLNVDQALADLAYFIHEMKKQPRFANSKVILYGGSYAGNMALWFKQRYPHLVEGVVASSGPIKGQVDFTGYLETVHDAFLSEGGQQCINIIKQGIDDTMAAMQSESGRRQMESAYRLCGPLDYDHPYELGYFSGLISWTFSSSVQTARPGNLLAICNAFTTDFFGVTPMQKIGGYVAFTRQLNPTSCWGLSYDAYVDNYRNPSALTMNSKAWYYQTCTEYGYYQTAPRIGTAFDSLIYLSVDFYVDLCKQVFDPRFDEAFVRDAVDRVNLIFGGLEPSVNNTINIHGIVDPWHALGVHDRDLSETSPTITVPRASHCFDMQSWLTTDTILMTQAQQRARRLVADWLRP